MKRLLIAVISTVLLIVAVFIVCTSNSNPYLSLINPKVILSSNQVKDRDTLDFYSTYSVSLFLNVSYHFTFCSVHISGNRLWSTADTFFTEDELDKNPYTLSFSFRDTGWKSIVVEGILTKGDTIRTTMNLYIRCPLRPVVYRAADSLLIKTLPVKDLVEYVFEINHTIFSSESPVVTIPYREHFLFGKLYIRSGDDRSFDIKFFIDESKFLIDSNLEILVDTVHISILDTIYGTHYYQLDSIHTISVDTNIIPFIGTNSAFRKDTMVITTYDTLKIILRDTVEQKKKKDQNDQDVDKE